MQVKLNGIENLGAKARRTRLELAASGAMYFVSRNDDEAFDTYRVVDLACLEILRSANLFYIGA
jgi:hypothetical protein